MHFGRIVGFKVFTTTASGVHTLTLVSLLLLFLVNNIVFLSSGRCASGNAVNRSCLCSADGYRTATVAPAMKADGPLVVVFTTFKETSDRVFFQSNTVRNWAVLRPLLQPVLFTMDERSYLTRLAGNKGWHVYPVPRANTDKTPFLKDMINFVRDRYPSAIYYGFANGDILFNDGLLRTLKGLWRKSNRLTNHVVIGRRFNMKLDTSSWRPLYKPADITAMVVDTGAKVFIPDAEDFFFFGGEYPWNKIPDVVMGRPGYDNYIVFMAIECNMTVIDATKTLLAFHQTGLDGDFAGSQNTDRGYNRDLIGEFDTWKGMVVSAQYRTKYDATGDLVVETAVPIWTLTRQRKKIEEQNRQNQLHRLVKNAVPISKRVTQGQPANPATPSKHQKSTTSKH